MTIQEQLIGTWRLISQETEFPDGRKEFARGEHPLGILMYDAAGNMSVQLVRNEPPLPETDLASFETAMAQYHGYFGTYEVDQAQGIVYHHIIGAAFVPYQGTKQVRHFILDGNRLQLSAEATTDGDDTKRTIIWEKIDGQFPTD